MALENGLYAQVTIICIRELHVQKERYITQTINSKDNQQEQNIGWILIMSGGRKIS